MKRAYIILGMKRSGHHALAYWIAHNWLPKASMLHNDCGKGWNKGFLLPTYPNENNQFVTVGEGETEIDIYNIEDFDVKHLDTYNFAKFSIFRPYNSVHIMLVVRDPYNWIASSLKTGGGPAKRLPNRIKLWKKQINFLKGNNLKQRNKILAVNYNDWFKQEYYRMHLAVQLKLPSFDQGINVTSPRGGGSSFDKMKFKNKASQMKVLERWKYFKGNSEFIKYIDTQIESLSKEFFHFHIPMDKLKGK
jgi:hypothetical protein